MRTKITTSLIYLCAAAAIVGFSLTPDLYYPTTRTHAELFAALLFATAGATLRYKPAVAHWIALVTGVLILVWFYLRPEFGSPIWNSWIVLNIPDNDPHLLVPHAKLTILAVWLTVAVVGTATLRLLPSNWTVRRFSVRERTWPALVLSFAVLAVWFSKAAIPYRIAGVADVGDAPIIRILHIQKRGLQFHETSIEVSLDGSFLTSRDDRRLFEYRFQGILTSGRVPQSLVMRALNLTASPTLRQIRTGPPTPLRAWNAEGWYFAAEGIRFQSYSTEIGTRPPGEIVELFSQVETVRPADGGATYRRKDVCLGFCYDPRAAFGALYANQRCRYDGNRYRCF